MPLLQLHQLLGVPAAACQACMLVLHTYPQQHSPGLGGSRDAACRGPARSCCLQRGSGGWTRRHTGSQERRSLVHTSGVLRRMND
jgi:hypothetical protein